jgi:hypothetical protein
MLKWSIKSSLITTVKCVNIRLKSVDLRLTPSLIAHIIQLVVLFLILWALLLSPTPIVILIYLIRHAIIYPELIKPRCFIGRLRLETSGELFVDDDEDEFKYAIAMYRPLMLEIGTVRGRRLAIWRDSCSEASYRRLLVVVKGLELK